MPWLWQILAAAFSAQSSLLAFLLQAFWCTVCSPKSYHMLCWSSMQASHFVGLLSYDPDEYCKSICEGVAAMLVHEQAIVPRTSCLPGKPRRALAIILTISACLVLTILAMLVVVFIKVHTTGKELFQGYNKTWHDVSINDLDWMFIQSTSLATTVENQRMYMITWDLYKMTGHLLLWLQICCKHKTMHTTCRTAFIF